MGLLVRGQRREVEHPALLHQGKGAQVQAVVYPIKVDPAAWKAEVINQQLLLMKGVRIFATDFDSFWLYMSNDIIVDRVNVISIQFGNFYKYATHW